MRRLEYSSDSNTMRLSDDREERGVNDREEIRELEGERERDGERERERERETIKLRGRRVKRAPACSTFRGRFC